MLKPMSAKSGQSGCVHAAMPKRLNRKVSPNFLRHVVRHPRRHRPSPNVPWMKARSATPNLRLCQASPVFPHGSPWPLQQPTVPDSVPQPRGAVIVAPRSPNRGLLDPG
jgi:hypothetical protein